jgi:hypothetical protein|tara:strand:+ start:168 stop:473 length:306 start_codon:yes stop_codon:yes gene_type:complete
MPTYTFHNKTTGVVEEKVMKISEMEKYLKDNPDVEQVHSGINIVAGVGGIKSDAGWKENLSRIAEAHPNSSLADRYGKKSIKQIKTKEVVKKHLRKQKQKI